MVLIAEPDRQLRTFVDGILADFGHLLARCADAREPRQRLRLSRLDVLAKELALDAKAREFSAEARRLSVLPVLALSGQPFGPPDDKYARPPQPHDKVLRFADLAMLIAEIRESELKASPVVAASSRKRH